MRRPRPRRQDTLPRAEDQIPLIVLLRTCDRGVQTDEPDCATLSQIEFRALGDATVQIEVAPVVQSEALIGVKPLIECLAVLGVIEVAVQLILTALVEGEKDGL